MIAAFMLYAVVLSLVIGTVAVIAERGAGVIRRPTRWLWVAAMTLMVVAPFAMVGLSTRVLPHEFAAPSLDASRFVGTRSGTETPNSSAASQVPNGWLQPQRDRTSITAAWLWVQRETLHLDRLLGIGWGLLSLTLGVYVARATRATYRLSASMPQRSVGQATVHVSEAIGPAAIGGPTPAIVLPGWVLELDPSLLDLVIRHEQEHLRARDPRLLVVGLVWLVLLPWHLPLWWAWKRLRLAIEVDCDARVLEGTESPRVYAQLLLFIGQHQQAQRERSVLRQLWIALPLTIQPQGRHLKRRITAMTSRPARKATRLLGLAIAVASTGTLALAIPAPHIAPGLTVIPELPLAARPAFVMVPEMVPEMAPVVVNVTRLGLLLDEAPTAVRPAMQIVIYAEGQVKLGIANASPAMVRDTIRLDHPPALSADVTQGALHIEMRNAAGSMELGGTASGGPMTTFTIRGRHIVLDKGGIGVRRVAGAGGATDSVRRSGR